jgi:hypothetical protein
MAKKAKTVLKDSKNRKASEKKIPMKKTPNKGSC